MEDTNALVITDDQMNLIRRTVANGATESELALYLYDCQRQRVHPLDKLLHFTKRGGRYVPVTSIDLMRSRAAETGEYAGSSDPVVKTAGKELKSATVTVTRIVQGQRCEFTATAAFEEYKPDRSPMWVKMPITMLSKCAEACALRKGFPQQLAGMYGKEELDQAVTELDIKAVAPSPLPAVPVSPGLSMNDEEEPQHTADTVDVSTGEVQPTAVTGKKVTGPQVKRIYGKIRSSGKDKDDVLAYVKETFGVDSFEDLVWNKNGDSPYDQVCQWIDDQ
tara:strand:+ start:3085 stop:3918 length:834 start_codon:yes stop_codon:yes gene_type:complete